MLQSEAGYIDARPLTASSAKPLATHGRTIHSGQSLRLTSCQADLRVRFRPKGDLISMPISLAHASRLCNRAEEYDHAGSSECCPSPQTSALGQGKADRGKAPAPPQARLVDPDKASDRRTRSRSGHVQSGNRQQASWL